MTPSYASSETSFISAPTNPLIRLNPIFRLRLILALISFGLISGVFISWDLWVTDRTFPHFPVLSLFPPFPNPFDRVVVIGLVGILAWGVISPAKWIFATAVSLMLLLALQDQMRWQPWFYQYMLMLTPFAFAKAKTKESASNAILGLNQLVVVAVYLWGGLHKCHSGFLSVYQNNLAKPIVDSLESPFLSSLVSGFGYLIPPIEILIALGLLFGPTRKAAIAGAIGTHIVILLLIGPAKGYLSNIVVWPWNVAMCGMVWVLFSNSPKGTTLAFLKSPQLKSVGCGICTLLFLCPLLFYFGKWDRYLSFNLYSGRQKQMLVKVDAEALENLPREWRPYLIDTSATDGHKILSISKWSTTELKVPLISEWRILRRLSQHICEQQGQPPFVFYVDHVHLPEKPKQFFTCDQIDQMRD